MVLQNGRTPLFTLEIPSFSSTSNITLSTFSRTRKPLISATSLKPVFLPAPTLPPTHGIHQALVYLKSCQASQKLVIKVVSPPQQEASIMAPELSPTAAPAHSSGEVSSSPAFPWAFRPRQAASPAPLRVPLVADKDDGMPMPFINSNPLVPLPTGEVDSATIQPLPISGHQTQVMIGSFGFRIALHSMALRPL